MNAPKIQEVYINSYLDRLVNQNELGGVFTALLPRGQELGLNQTEQDKNMYFKVMNLQIPNTSYNFPTKASKFFWETNYNTGTGAGDSVEQFQIDTNRVYASPSALIDELNTKVQAVDASLNFSYDDTTKKITLTNDNTYKIRVISAFRYATTESVLTNNDINDRLGFSQDLTASNGVINENGGTLEGAGVINMNRTNNYYLVLDEASSSFNQTIVPSKPARYRVICNVPVGSYGTLSTLSYVSAEWFSLPRTAQLPQLTFRILDDEFDTLENELPNNIPISLSLQIKIE